MHPVESYLFLLTALTVIRTAANWNRVRHSDTIAIISTIISMDVIIRYRQRWTERVFPKISFAYCSYLSFCSREPIRKKLGSYEDFNID